MPKYRSKTGKDIVLRFKGNILTVPVVGFVETTGEDLEYLFPNKIEKLNDDVILEEIEHQEITIKEIPSPKFKDVKIDINVEKEKTPKQKNIDLNLSKIEGLALKPVEITISNAYLGDSKNVFIPNIQNINTPKLTSIKDLKGKIDSNIAQTINNYVEENDFDLEAFLDMIRMILTEDKKMTRRS